LTQSISVQNLERVLRSCEGGPGSEIYSKFYTPLCDDWTADIILRANCSRSSNRNLWHHFLTI